MLLLYNVMYDILHYIYSAVYNLLIVLTSLKAPGKYRAVRI